MDESWDAADFQNMFLAMVPAANQESIIPSFHRPALVNYWMNRVVNNLGIPASTFRNPPPDSTGRAIRDLKRAIMLRPLPEDHPNFPGITATFLAPSITL